MVCQCKVISNITLCMRVIIHSPDITAILSHIPDITAILSHIPDITAILSHITDITAILSHITDISTILEKMNYDLETCQRSLLSHLDKRRQRFPRFYFLSTEDVLRIICHGKYRFTLSLLLIRKSLTYLTQIC